MVFKLIQINVNDGEPLSIDIKTLTLDELVDMFLNIKVDYEIKIQYFLDNEKNIKSEIEKLRNSDYKKGDGTISKIKRLISDLYRNHQDIKLSQKYLKTVETDYNKIKNWAIDDFTDYFCSFYKYNLIIRIK